MRVIDSKEKLRYALQTKFHSQVVKFEDDCADAYCIGSMRYVH